MARTPKVVEDRREQIIDAAMRVFAEKGFARATNKDIAQEAGITPGLIYHYFESKEALLKAMLEERSPLKIVNTLPEQLFDQSPEFVLRSLITQILLLVENEQFIQLIRVLLSEVLFNPQMTFVGAEALQQGAAVIATFMRRKMESGELRMADPEVATQILIGSIMGFVFRRQLLHDPSVQHYTHKQIVDAIVSNLLEGLLPR